MAWDSERPKQEVPVHFPSTKWMAVRTQTPPMNEYQALMDAAPGEDPEEVLGDRLERAEAVSEVIDRLDPQSKWIIEAVAFERLSFSELGVRLGRSKTQAYRLYKRALEELEHLIRQEDQIMERINNGF